MDGNDSSNVVPLEDAELALFDGVTLAGWHEYNSKEAHIKGWTIIDSSIVCLGSVNQSGGDLVSDHEYENMELSWDWKMDAKSNSGVLYHVVEDQKYKSAPETGPEYQLIDDEGYPERLENWQKTAADYAMYAPISSKKLNPPGQWNSSRIIYNNGHVEHWLNGIKIVQFEAGSKEWKNRLAASKWKTYPAYAKSSKGKIVLQNYGRKVYFRNIIIKEL